MRYILLILISLYGCSHPVQQNHSIKNRQQTRKYCSLCNIKTELYEYISYDKTKVLCPQCYRKYDEAKTRIRRTKIEYENIDRAIECINKSILLIETYEINEANDKKIISQINIIIENNNEY